MGGSGNIEIKIVDDLILLRCKEAFSPLEVNVATLKAGRFLLQEVGDRLCQELKPNLNTLLYRITGLRLLDACMSLFVERREKIYLFIMSGAVEE